VRERAHHALLQQFCSSFCVQSLDGSSSSSLCVFGFGKLAFLGIYRQDSICRIIVRGFRIIVRIICEVRVNIFLGRLRGVVIT
jgi:hypothetical protein